MKKSFGFERERENISDQIRTEQNRTEQIDSLVLHLLEVNGADVAKGLGEDVARL